MKQEIRNIAVKHSNGQSYQNTAQTSRGFSRLRFAKVFCSNSGGRPATWDTAHVERRPTGSSSSLYEPRGDGDDGLVVVDRSVSGRWQDCHKEHQACLRWPNSEREFVAYVYTSHFCTWCVEMIVFGASIMGCRVVV